ncbi:MAG: substrate-binding domain-containing protein [Prochloraceae cyanobacterium]|nr:substrate-binding domain-containing protein [Prochloraceae cyanobacterium]
MSKQNNKSIDFLTSVSTVILIMAALLWSLGLVGRGVWRLTQEDNLNPTQSETSTTEKPIESEKSNAENFAQVQNVPTGLFRYGGSNAWAPIRLLLDSAIQAERPEFQLRYVENDDSLSGSSTGIQMLLEDKLTFIQSSYPLQDSDYSQAEQRGFKIKQIPVAIDAIAVAVHPQLNIPGLTLDQLKSIYSGQIVNWQQLGGPDLEITAYSRPVKTGGTVEFFIEYVLRGQKLDSNVKFVSTTTEGLRRLADTPGGIYYASAPLIVRQCSIHPLPLSQVTGEFVPPYQEPFVSANLCPQQRNKLNMDAFQKRYYPLTRYLYVVVKENGGIEEQVGDTYANFLRSTQGQELIFRAGFVPLR